MTLTPGAVFAGARLSEANLSGAGLREANLSTAKGLTEEQLATAHLDGDTKLSNDLQHLIPKADDS